MRFTQSLALFTLSSLAGLCSVPLLVAEVPSNPEFQDVTVHDPSVVRVDGTYYIFGSHMAAAKSNDLIAWTLISSPFANPSEELAEALTWSATESSNSAHWAPDVVQAGEDRFYFYYCTGNLRAPRGYLGLAVADKIEGPYQNQGLIRRSGEPGFDASIHPNAVDPHTFFDKEGLLWMVYGSYSGGMFILQMNPETGLPADQQSQWGTHLVGGHHSRIEAPYILYSPDTDYYYLFVSFGGLGATGGYDMRVARSRNPAGPYHDSTGKDMREVKGTPGTLFDDPAYEPYGVKLAGGSRFLHVEGEPRTRSWGYRSPGHNSAYHDADTGKYYNIFHTRFAGRPEHAEFHQVRVHQMFMNEDGWLVMAPHRYAGETIGEYSKEQIVGDFKYINHGKAISSTVVESEIISLQSDGSVSGAATGTWELRGENRIDLTLDGKLYRGVFVRQWDDDNQVWVMTFTALSEEGISVWGSQVAKPTER